MLGADRAQAVRLLGLPVAVEIPIADPHARVALDLVVDAGHRDAAFAMPDYLGRGPCDLWIDVGARAVLGVELEHHDAQRDADMGCGDADSGRGAHGLE